MTNFFDETSDGDGSQETSFAHVSLDTVQEYWDRRPCNIRHSPSEVGTRQYFDEVEERRYFVEPHIPGFAEFDRWRGKKVLELGCGIGTDTMMFARAGAQVTAVDLSPKSLEVARRRAEVYGLGNDIHFHVADAESLSEVVRPERYDLVYAFGVVHHTPRPDNVIRQIREHYLDTGGTLKIMVYNRYSWKTWWIVATQGRGAFWKAEELVARHSEAQEGCPITYTYTQSGLRRLLGGSFDITQMQVQHIFPYRIPDYVNYRYLKEWYFRYMPPVAFRWLQRRLGWHLSATATAL